MNDDLRQRVLNFFASEIQGGTCQNDLMGLFDEAIEADVLTQKEFRQNESALCNLVDDRWFYCVRCGWVMPIDMQHDGDHDEPICESCGEDE
jgi:hypothetical protein